MCGREPSDTHHLRFAQPRALGRKVSDEFTVPVADLITANFTGMATRRHREPEPRERRSAGSSYALYSRGRASSRNTK